jgi:phage RecT family recombinase
MKQPAQQPAVRISASQQIAKIESEVITKDLARRYSHVKRNADLKFVQEKMFFMEHVRRNTDLRQAIPASLTQAFMQAASIGLSFNPTLAHCYLIPRRAKRGDSSSPFIAYASPGYRGMLHLAVTGGAIKFGRAEVVHERDHFRYFGPTTKPDFEAGGKGASNAMTAKRGARVGVFCEAQLNDGTWLADMMDKSQIERVVAMSETRNSMMYDDKKFQEEGWKKIIIRRAWKTWPGVAAAPLLAHAMEILNENEGAELGKPDEVQAAVVLVSDEQVSKLHALITEAGLSAKNADKWLGRLAEMNGCASIQDLPADKFKDAEQAVRDRVAAYKQGSPK